MAERGPVRDLLRFVRRLLRAALEEDLRTLPGTVNLIGGVLITVLMVPYYITSLWNLLTSGVQVHLGPMSVARQGTGWADAVLLIVFTMTYASYWIACTWVARRN